MESPHDTCLQVVDFYIFHERIEMKRTNKVLLATILTLTTSTLIGCGEEVHTVDWYTEHKAERQERIAQCDNNPGKLDATPNCINARESLGRYSIHGPMPKGW
ncbi:MAG: EexN family lipoprotein [Candidatus Accumulibacter sp.]|jgi:hypothetical protein|nr:EexN family lipoprotein [Accumulibacter sp.]